MPINPRLAAKLDQALVLARPRRSCNGREMTAFVADFARRCAGGEPFDVVVDGRVHTVDPERVRVSGTVIDLGLPFETVRVPVRSVAFGDEVGDDPRGWEFASADRSDCAMPRTLRFVEAEDDGVDAAPHREFTKEERMPQDLETLAQVATRVTRRFVERQAQPAVATPTHVDVHYANAMCGDEVGGPFFAKVTSVAELEKLFGTEITAEETLMMTTF